MESRGDFMSDEALLTPQKSYNQYKEKHKDNVTKYFEDLTKEAKTDIETNKKTVSKYNDASKICNELESKVKKYKAAQSLLIILYVIIAIVFFVLAFKCFSKSGGFAVVGVILLVLIVALIPFLVIFIKKLKNKVKELSKQLEENEKIRDKLLNEAWGQMATLNALFDDGISQKLTTKTLPIVIMDKILDNKKLERLKSYGLKENNDVNVSTQYVQSGSILGNPFLITRDLVQKWKQKTYTGTLFITWTEYEHTKDGTKAVHHSQTLTATVVKPAPYYFYDTRLHYGNDAAPNLTFTRDPSNTKGFSEKQYEKFVEKESKKLDKKADKAISKGGNYVKLGNDEFETLFGADDRNNEVEFRLLYTPIAQKNIIDLIKTNNPYGDDFFQYKNKKLNTIISSHSQTFDFTDNPLRYVGYDYETMKKYFIDYNMKYFESFYFDLAPLMSIPLYQQNKAEEFIYSNNYKSNITSFEQESMANSFNLSIFRPSNACTKTILKSNFMYKDGQFDNIMVNAYSFNAVKRVTYIPRHGGDGHMHLVPVYWIEYLPVSKETKMAVEEKQSSRIAYNEIKNTKEFKDSIKGFATYNNYRRGIFASVGNYVSSFAATNFNNVFKDLKPEEIDKKRAMLDAAILSAIALEGKESKNEDNDEIDVEKMLKDDKVKATEVKASESEEKQEETK